MVKEKLKKIIPTDVAIWSLCVAVIALSLNAFLSQRAEGNLNKRQAAFELILQLGELRNVTDQIQYNDADKETLLINGWGKIDLIEDLSGLLPKPFPEKAGNLKSIWDNEHKGLAVNTESVDAIRGAIDDMRMEIKYLLRAI